MILIGLLAGFLLSGPVLAGDLDVVFEKDVAAVTPDMEVIPPDQGSLSVSGGLGLDYQTTGLAKLKEQGVNIWAEEAPTIGAIPSISKNKVLSAGFIIPEASAVGSITHILAENQLVATEGMVVYLDIGKESGLVPGDRFTVFSEEREIRHPVKKEDKREWVPRLKSSGYREAGAEYPPLIDYKKPGRKVGRLIRVLGYVDVLDVGMGSSKAMVQKIFDDIRAGDLIMPYQEPVVAKMASSSGKSIEGYVVAFKEETITAMNNDIIYIDVGSDHGVRPGDVFQIYIIPEKSNKTKWYEFHKDRTTPLTPLIIGEIQVLAVQAKSATTLILDLVDDLKGPGQFVRYKP
ncbi:hypothetical protein UZ36_02365 [Candidatus Nitromaritima sp. SCGC AAA799-C22]|nr:hypothetical protein UZ36_02365 [Candidatus Nitromaritima sp. SCGC AAA799-C22]